MPTDILTIEARIGVRPWTNQGQEIVEQGSTTTDLTEWCIHKGMPHSKILELTFDQLVKCYITENYFKTVAGLRPRSTDRRTTERFRNSLNWKSLSELEDKAGGTPNRQYNIPSITNALALDPQNPVQELLKTVDLAIDRKLKELRESLKIEAVASVTSIMRDVRTATFENIKSSLEAGTLELKLGPETQDRILKLVRDTAEEVIFQTARDRATLPAENTIPVPTFTGDREQGEGAIHLPQVGGNPSGNSSGNSSYIPTIDPYFYFDPFPTRVIRTTLTHGGNTYLSGDTGCGKTTHVEQVCAVMNRGMFRVNPHDGITKEFFLGGMKFLAGETKWIDGVVPICMKKGLALVVDEFSWLTANLSAILHPVMEPGGRLYIPDTGEFVSPAPGFCVFATDNTGGKGDINGQYVGTEVQNSATLDRFDSMVRMTYIPKDKEEEMLSHRFPALAQGMPGELNSMLSLAAEIRNAFSRGELATTLSTRGLIQYLTKREQGYTQTESLSLCLLSWLDEDDSELVKVMLDRLDIKLED